MLRSFQKLFRIQDNKWTITAIYIQPINPHLNRYSTTAVEASCEPKWSGAVLESDRYRPQIGQTNCFPVDRRTICLSATAALAATIANDSFRFRHSLQPSIIMDSQDNKHSQEVKVNGNAENSPAANVGNHNESSSKGNEDRKIFVGGIAYDVTNDDLTQHFSTFGEVTQAQVKYDRITGRSRGFAFVEFATGEGCKQALVEREQTIKNKTVEVKPAKSRENKKVFVGGLPADFPEEELRAHFEAYGKVEDIEWPFDKQTKTKRNFAFIVFEEEEAADRASSIAKQTFGSRDCDVKKAVPQGKRNGMRLAGNMRAPFVGGRGGMPGPAANGWFGGSAWNQPVPYMPSNGHWAPEWYQNQSNFYANNGHHFSPYNGVTANGFENYGQNGAAAPRPNNNQRFPQATAQQF